MKSEITIEIIDLKSEFQEFRFNTCPMLKHQMIQVPLVKTTH